MNIKERVNTYHELQFCAAKKIPNRHGDRFGMVTVLGMRLTVRCHATI